MPTCSQCKQDQDKSNFSLMPSGNNRSICKKCAVINTIANQRTQRGLVNKIYQNQIMTSKKRNRPAPAYTSDELFNWMLSKNYIEFWQNWVNSGYEKDLSPSIDRINNDLFYSLDNIQLVTWRQNLLNQKNGNIAGTFIHTGSKSVDKYTLDGEYICTYPSMKIACRDLGKLSGTVSNITGACTGKFKKAYGFTWKFTKIALS